jgi:thiosulfate/3-mercaptopyruvate sulfurtransferase
MMNSTMVIRRLRALGIMAALAGAACSTGGEETTPISDEIAVPDPGPFADRGYASTHRLVTTSWVEAHLNDPSVVLVDVRPAEGYVNGHLPEAVNMAAPGVFQATDERGVEGMLPKAGDVAAALGSIGATPESTIVVYDDRRNVYAARGVWVLSVYGHEDVRMIDGAMNLWQEEARPIVGRIPVVEPTTYAFDDPPDTSLIAGWQEVVSAIDDPAALVCDARSPGEYSGETVRAERSGHVPGAINVEWNRAVDESGRFLSATDLRELYAGQGVVGGETVYTYCQSGVRAAHTWFVLSDLLGYENVKVYDGSWTEYGNREDSPIKR